VSRVTRNLLLAIAIVVVGLGAGYTIGHRSASTTTTSTTSTTSTTAATPTSAPTSTTTTTVSLTTCRGSDFTGANVGSEGAAGTGYDIMTLTKVSTGSCVVDGYPIVSFFSAKGVVVTGLSVGDATNFPVGPAHGAPSAHTVTSGGKVDLQLRYSDLPVGTTACPSVAQVNVQLVAGDASVPVSFPYPISPCGGSLVVSPFYPG
jgi:hypothetical protein